MITVRDLRVELGGRVVLDGLDIDLPDDGVVAVMGPNGSGKTTLGRVLLGLVPPTSGVVDGRPARCSAVFQEDRLCEHLDAVANVRLVLPRDVSSTSVVTALRDLGLPADALRRPVRALSGGQRRRVVIARALLPAADLVFLDEPLTGIDADGREAVLAWIAEACRGRAVLLVTHDRADAERLHGDVVELAPHHDRRALDGVTDARL
ncbi:ATP-binding cassette domain-containing protein [Cellulomonas fimi]|uniref:ABC transporter related protein n=1 Tax=Cellulomonas fimi (strain ATCC 484 / DSM 20113 / JCM 1341 / CCUG 24087 / LMG 16345 / NBRC 15513 / NCIMB 8980 / NCTC 7547 / NRS-133) TaxID=590998 RepID=F4H591_CELFA|nr:ABC transporter ATP-binding protein [Cellulomonas fimi]AEE46697.1 ABC transporter related protein [Cellulomonas fimi ATCC 484]NNH07658.1 ABC transporter ATP-binding protein [Cellulomonas fimi]VEH33915.1 Probable amino-acid import ATP-binding protein YxeO [Cellulomonas fimi]